MALAGEDYSIYLTSKYENCENIRLGLPKNSFSAFLSNPAESLGKESSSSVGVSVVVHRGTSERRLRVSDSISVSPDGRKSSDRIKQSDNQVDSQQIELQHQLFNGYWFSILTGLSQITTASTAHPTIREAALTSLFTLLIELGHKHLNPDMWQMIIKGVFFPLFDDLNLSIQHTPREIPPPAPKPTDSKPDVRTPVAKVHPPPATPATPAAALASSSHSRTASTSRRRSTVGDDWAAGLRCWSALKHLVNLVEKQFDYVSPFLGDILNLIVSVPLLG